MKKVLISLFLISLVFLQICLISAEEGIEVTIQNNTIVIRGYTISPIMGKVDAGFFSKVNESLGSVAIKCDNFTIDNITYQANCSSDLNYEKAIQFTMNQSYTTIIGDTQLQRNLEDCLALKAQFNAGLDSCVIEKNKRADQEVNLSTCNLNLVNCNNEKSNAVQAKTSMETEQADNKNQKYIWAGIAAVLACVATLFYCGRLGVAKAHDPESSYNRSQAA